jgi:hypothetical protein
MHGAYFQIANAQFSGTRCIFHLPSIHFLKIEVQVAIIAHTYAQGHRANCGQQKNNRNVILSREEK